MELIVRMNRTNQGRDLGEEGFKRNRIPFLKEDVSLL